MGLRLEIWMSPSTGHGAGPRSPRHATGRDLLDEDGWATTLARLARLLDECADEWTSERHGAQVHVVAVFDGFGVMDALVRSQRLLQALHATWTPLHTSVSDDRSALVARTEADVSDDALDGSSPATVDASDDRAMPRRPRAGLG